MGNIGAKPPEHKENRSLAPTAARLLLNPGSVRSGREPPMLSLTSRRVSSSTMSFASRSDLARRSSLVTTNASPARQAARACPSPGRALFVPVRPSPYRYGTSSIPIRVGAVAVELLSVNFRTALPQTTRLAGGEKVWRVNSGQALLYRLNTGTGEIRSMCAS